MHFNKYTDSLVALIVVIAIKVHTYKNLLPLHSAKGKLKLITIFRLIKMYVSS